MRKKKVTLIHWCAVWYVDHTKWTSGRRPVTTIARLTKAYGVMPTRETLEGAYEDMTTLLFTTMRPGSRDSRFFPTVVSYPSNEKPPDELRLTLNFKIEDDDP